MDAGPFPMSKWRFVALVLVLSFGLAAFFGAVSLEALSGPIVALGVLLIVPLAILLGDDFPGIASVGDEATEQRVATDATASGDATASAGADDQIERLRERYARGEIDEAEFERRVERLLETKDLEREVGGTERQREFDLE